MRGSPTRGARRRSITPSVLLLMLAGFMALTYIILLPAQAGGAYLDGAGTASLENSPVRPLPSGPRQAGSGQARGQATGRSQGEGEAGSSSVTSGGGLGVPGLPLVERIRCLRQCVSTSRPTRGAIIGIQGKNLDRVIRVIFRTRNGQTRVKWRTRRRGAVRVTVPRRAVGGFVTVVDSSGNRSRSPEEMPVLPVSEIPIEVFPVRGPVSFGSSGSRFGAGRPGHIHQGQDVSASCGTPLVAIRRSRVLYNRWDGGGGNYVVLHNLESNTNFVYMHMIRRSPLDVGQVVGAGAQIGRVGSTGASSGCHLHFEYWIGPWQTGGQPIDPLPFLRSLLGN